MLGLTKTDIEYQKTDAQSGNFAFTAKETGEHKICFKNRGSIVRKVDLDLKTGVNAKDYSAIAKREQLEPLEVRVASSYPFVG